MKFNLFLALTLVFNVSFGQFSREFDKYENEVTLTYNTPYVSFYKYIKNADTTYQTAFYVYDTYLTSSGRDAVLLFSNGDKLELSGEVDVAYSNNGYYRYTFYSFDKNIVEKISETKLVGFKLHIFKKDLNAQNITNINTAAKKILISK